MKQAVFDLLILFIVSLLRYFGIAGTAFILFYRKLAAKLASSKIQARKATQKDFIREILHSSASSVWLAVTAFIVVEGPLKRYTLIYTDIHAWPLVWLPVSLLLALIIHDTYFYWMHRMLHIDRLFTLTHRLHHRSTNPSPWAAYSFSMIEALLEGAVVILLAFVLPLHPSVIFAFASVSFVINVYGHLGYEIMPESFRRSVWFGIINTSCYHNLHHKKFKGNYSLYFRFWDRVMGTEHPDYVKEYDWLQQKRFPG
jgi:Delta7-sterol 5-desaturase